MFTMLMIMFGVFNIFYFVGQFGELATAGYSTAVELNSFTNIHGFKYHCSVNSWSKLWCKNVS